MTYGSFNSHPRRGERVRYTKSGHLKGQQGVVDWSLSYATAIVRWDNGVTSRVRYTSIERIPATLTTHETWVNP